MSHECPTCRGKGTVEGVDPEGVLFLGVWLPVVCRRQRHTGNLTYLLPLDRAAGRAIQRRYGSGLPYVKLDPRSPTYAAPGSLEW